MTLNLYITPIEYRKATTGQETNSLVSNLLRVGSNIALGATALPTSAVTTTSLSPYDTITIFDGSNSEQVTVTSETVAGASSIPISATLYAHNAGVVMCSDGTNASLAEAILVGSANIESICQQALFQTTYVETLTLRTMGANVNKELQLWIRPRHFPVISISALSIEPDVADTVTYDPAQAIIDSNQKLINIPVVKVIGSGPSLTNVTPPVNQSTPGFVNLTYQAGFPYASLPWDIKQAAVLLTSNVLSDRKNPTGAADLQIGKRKATVFLRGDLSGEAALYKRAVSLLTPYMRVR